MRHRSKSLHRHALCIAAAVDPEAIVLMSVKSPKSLVTHHL